MKNLATFSILIFFFLWGNRLSAQSGEEAILHKVEKGNTIYSLSRSYQVSISELKAWNKLKSNTLKVGDELVVGYKKLGEIAPEPETVAPENLPEKKNEVPVEGISMEPKEDKKVTKPATLEDLGTSIDDENIYNISLETVEDPEINEARDLSNAMALPKPTSLVFCGGVENSVPIGVSTVFYQQEESAYFYVFLENSEQFDDSGLIVELYQKEPFSKRFNNHLSTKKYSIKERWKYTNFKYDIPEAGEYRMLVFNSEKKKLGEGFFVILSK